MPASLESPALSRLLPGLTALYFFASLGHFAHNAEFICTYPNLPAWLTRTQVYASWAGVTAIGALGLFLLHKKRAVQGLLLIAAYAALGFDGLAHYAVAPMAWHTWGANVTILSEVFAAALLLTAAGWTLVLRVRDRADHSAIA